MSPKVADHTVAPTRKPLRNLHIEPNVRRKVSARLATHYLCVPLALHGNILHIAMADPLNVETIDELRLLLKCDIKPFLAGPGEIRQALQRYYGLGASTLETIADEQAVPEYTLPTVTI